MRVNRQIHFCIKKSANVCGISSSCGLKCILGLGPHVIRNLVADTFLKTDPRKVSDYGSVSAPADWAPIMGAQSGRLILSLVF